MKYPPQPYPKQRRAKALSASPPAESVDSANVPPPGFPEPPGGRSEANRQSAIPWPSATSAAQDSDQRYLHLRKDCVDGFVRDDHGEATPAYSHNLSAWTNPPNGNARQSQGKLRHKSCRSRRSTTTLTACASFHCGSDRVDDNAIGEDPRGDLERARCQRAPKATGASELARPHRPPRGM